MKNMSTLNFWQSVMISKVKKKTEILQYKVETIKTIVTKALGNNTAFCLVSTSDENLVMAEFEFWVYLQSKEIWKDGKDMSIEDEIKEIVEKTTLTFNGLGADDYRFDRTTIEKHYLSVFAKIKIPLETDLQSQKDDA